MSVHQNASNRLKSVNDEQRELLDQKEAILENLRAENRVLRVQIASKDTEIAENQAALSQKVVALQEKLCQSLSSQARQHAAVDATELQEQFAELHHKLSGGRNLAQQVSSSEVKRIDQEMADLPQTIDMQTSNASGTKTVQVSSTAVVQPHVSAPSATVSGAVPAVLCQETASNASQVLESNSPPQNDDTPLSLTQTTSMGWALPPGPAFATAADGVASSPAMTTAACARTAAATGVEQNTMDRRDSQVAWSLYFHD